MAGFFGAHSDSWGQWVVNLLLYPRVNNDLNTAYEIGILGPEILANRE